MRGKGKRKGNIDRRLSGERNKEMPEEDEGSNF